MTKDVAKNRTPGQGSIPASKDYRTGYTHPESLEPEPTKFTPVKHPPCIRLIGKKREPCDGHGVLLDNTRKPATYTIVAGQFDPHTGRIHQGETITYTADPPFDPLAHAYFWYRCDTCGNKFSMRGKPAQPRQKKEKGI